MSNVKPHNKTDDPVASLEDLKRFIFPEGYAVDLVTEGTESVDKDTKGTTIHITKMHVVSESGKVMCTCKLNPKTVFVFVSVDVPPDFGELWCEGSQLFMRREIDKLSKGTTS